MRRLVSAVLFLVGATLSQAVADIGNIDCLSSPTRSCILGMAAEANVAAGKIVSLTGKDQESSDRYLLVWNSWVDILKTAAKTGDLDLALSLAPSIDNQFAGMDASALIAALKLAGRDAELASFLGQLGGDDRSADRIFGPALVAAGRAADFKAFVASRNYAPYDVVAMEAAGNFLAGKPQDGLALIEALHGTFRKAAGINTLGLLQGTGHGDIAVPLVKYQDLDTVDGDEACALVAQAARDKVLAEQCLAAASPLSEAAARDGAYLYAVAPQLVGALAAVGDWQEALTVLRQLEPGEQMNATEKLAKFSHAPELLERARVVLSSPGPMAKKRGGLLVRMLVLAGQPDEAAKFAATAPDAATRDDWSRLQAEALAEMDDTPAALALAAGIVDPVARAYALCAAAKALKS